MTIALATHASVANGGALTTGAIDTTGASLLVQAAVWFNSDATPTMGDSKANTWTGLTVRAAARYNIRLFYAANPTVGTGHTFTTGASTENGSLAAVAFSGVATSTPFDQQNGAISATSETTLQTGSVTPSAAGQVIVTAFGVDDPANTGTPKFLIDLGFTIIETQDVNSGVSFGVVLAYLIQTSASAVNPMWTRSNANSGRTDAAVIATFKAAVGGGGSSPLLRNSTLDGLGASGKFFTPPLGYHRTPAISLEAYRREQARTQREFIASVRRAA